MLEELGSRLACLVRVFKAILDDKSLVLLMQYTLLVGNYLNGSGFRGNASGFKFGKNFFVFFYKNRYFVEDVGHENE